LNENEMKETRRENGDDIMTIILWQVNKRKYHFTSD
jgi:hypothetical protein